MKWQRCINLPVRYLNTASSDGTTPTPSCSSSCRRLMHSALDCYHIATRCLLICSSRPQPRVGQLPLQFLLRATESPLYRAHSPQRDQRMTRKHMRSEREETSASARRQAGGSERILPGYRAKIEDTVGLRAGPTF